MPIDEVLQRQLIPEQREAARDPAREVRCLACAGSGKSTTLGYRIAWLVAEGAAPSGIVAFTFTDKAAETIKLRVSKALAAAGLETAATGAMYIGTIHSYCYNVLEEWGQPSTIHLTEGKRCRR
jgi:DNA helicase-2/ATP-dependent DNA helicase PcrA